MFSLKQSLIALFLVSLSITLFYKGREPTRNIASQTISRIHSSPLFLPEKNKIYFYNFQRKIHFEGLSNNSPEISYHGVFSIHVFESNKEGFEALVSEKIAEYPQQTKSIKIKVSSDAKKITLYTDPLNTEAEKEIANILKDLVANWLYPMESDTVGKYLASFEEDSHNPLQIKKKKIRYTALNTIEILSSEHVAIWSPEMKLPKSVAGVEKSRLGSGKSAILAQSEYQIQFSKIESGDIAKSSLPQFSISTTLALSNENNSFGNPEYEKLNWGDLQKNIFQLEAMNSKEQLKVFGELSQYLRMHPESLPEIVALLNPEILSAGSRSPLFKTLIGALATAGTSSSQAALIDLYQDANTSLDGKGTILNALNTTQAPIDAPTREFLASEFKSQSNAELATGAAFALGSALQNAPQDSSKAEIQLIESRWQVALASHNESLELNLLDIMGNSGRAEFYPDIAAIIQSKESPVLRARAIFALRFEATEGAITILDTSLSDPDTSAREASAKAMQTAAWNEKFRAPLQHCVQAETQTKIQKLCQAVLDQAAASSTVASN